MATHIQAFASSDGGYEGSAAIIDNSSQFYVDLGKSEAYAELILADTSATMNLLDYGNVLGIEVVIEDSYGGLNEGPDANSFDTALYHQSSTSYTDAVTTLVASTDPIERIIGGPSNTWGKTWSATDINNLRVKLNNPTEPNGGGSIALIATFVYARITYIIPGPHEPTLTIATGRVNLQQGNITI